MMRMRLGTRAWIGLDKLLILGPDDNEFSALANSGYSHDRKWTNIRCREEQLGIPELDEL